MSRLPDNLRNQAVGMLHAGMSTRRIAAALGCHASTIVRLHQRLLQTGNVQDRPRTGRPKVTTPAQDAQVQAAHRQDRFLKATTTARNTIGINGRNVSDDTIRRRLYAIGFNARRPKKGLILTARHRQGRLNWATRHLRFTRRQWGQVLFSDETKVSVNRLDGRVRVCRACGERVADQCVQRYDRWGGGIVHIWAGMSQFGRTNLVILNGNVNAHRYVNDILQPEVIPYMRQNLRGGIYQHDNARPHTANLTTNFLGNNNVNVLDWLSLSQRTSGRSSKHACMHVNHHRTTFQQLRQALIQEWNNIPQNDIANET